ncbi:MAG: hypothetical protein J0M18_10130 [Ignavibacteria bacterium]|nr:hypothetical protein [Ignavibacteria bacterium]
MRYISITVLFAAFLLLFSSCNEDSIIGPSTESSNYYEWSTFPVSFNSVANISAAKNQTLFVSGSKSYKITNGVVSEINFNDSNFRANLVFAYDDTYAVFLGTNNTAEQFLKIYDNGVINTYAWSPTTASGDIYFEQKEKFFYCNSYSNVYYYFNNGTMTPYTLPAAILPKFIRKIGDSVYLFANFFTRNSSSLRVYKISIAGFTEVYRGENQGEIFPLTNDVIRLTRDNANNTFDYFKETDWQNLFTNSLSANSQYISSLSGDTKSFMLAIGINPSGEYTAFVYNGNSYTKQANFIPGAFSGNSSLWFKSNYADNMVYFVNQYDATKIIKAKLK